MSRPPAGDGRPGSYAGAGVDISAGERAVDLMRAAVARTAGPEVIGGIGGFAGLFDASKLSGMRHPLLATSTDGVGTKIVLAQRLGRFDTVGLDLVGMVVDDLVVCGAEPLFMTDYVVCGRVLPERIATIVSGIAEGCVQAGCALIGGETAEHPGQLGPDDIDLAGAATGVVEADGLLGPDRVRSGDVLIAMASSGLHANGFSLVRAIIDAPAAGLSVAEQPAELDRPLGEELLVPTRIYARDCLALADSCAVHAFAHITGGGLAANLARVLPPGSEALIDRGSWRPAPVFGLLATRGNVPPAEMERVFNMGVGMVAVVAAADADRALRLLAERNVPAWVIGAVTATSPGRDPRTPAGTSPGSDPRTPVVGPGRVRLTGQHPA